jgi:hypothetical protein
MNRLTNILRAERIRVVPRKRFPYGRSQELPYCAEPFITIDRIEKPPGIFVSRDALIKEDARNEERTPPWGESGVLSSNRMQGRQSKGRFPMSQPKKISKLREPEVAGSAQ